MAQEQKRLTRQEAERLVAGSQRIDVTEYDSWEAGCAEVFASYKEWIDTGIKELSEDDARHLSGFKGKGIRLNGLTKLSCSNVEHLIRLGEKLYSISFRAFDNSSEHLELAKNFVKNHGGLQLDYMTSISKELASVISEAKYELSLGVYSLDPEMAMILAKCTGNLIFRNLRSIDDITAKYLSRHRGQSLEIGLSELSDNAAGYFANYRGENLTLGFQRRYFSNEFEGELSDQLNLAINYQEFSEEGESEVMKIYESVTIDLAKKNCPSDQAIRNLMDFNGAYLNLSILKYISVEAGKILATCQASSLHITDIIYIELDGSDHLTRYKGDLRLSGYDDLFMVYGISTKLFRKLSRRK